MDAATFLRRFPPFDGLDDDQLRHAAEAARMGRYPAGSVILRRFGEPARALYVIVEGSVDLVAEGRVLDTLGEGNVFGQMSVVTGQEPVLTIRARTDAVCLLLERKVAEEVLGTPAGAAFLTASLRERFDRLSAAEEGQPIRSPEATIGSLVHGKPVICDPSTTVAAVARAMTEVRASAAVIPFPEGPGIVTDVDLRTKVLAVGRDPNVPVGDIATAPAATIAEDALAAEALFQMVEGGYHHLPVVSGGGEVIGVVTETDVIGFGADSPFAIRTAIERASDAASVIDVALRLPGSVVALVDGSVDAVHVGHVVGATVDVLTRRLLDLAFEQHGSPPVPWAWLAFGSLGRREQALQTDQDHGIAFDAASGDEEHVRAYFGEVATFVTTELERAGIPRCRGNLMAVNPRLRLSLDGWVGAFERWTRGQEEFVAGAASILFDFRRVAGPLEVEPSLDRIVRASGREPGFLPRLAVQAIENKPPTGRVRDFIVEGSGEHEGALDVKHGGIVPITDFARIRMVEAGASAHRTVDRLRLASEAGRIGDDTRQGLEDAFRLLWQLRLEHQVACVRAGSDVDDFIDPKTLSPVMRQSLREAFRTITREQRALSVETMWSAP